MVEMRVFGLALDEKNQSPVLILKDLGEEIVLPIWIGAMEAMAISLALNKVEFPRPMTHDLLLSAISSLGGRVARIDIVRIADGTFYAELVVEQGGTERRIDARPSDAIAVAVRAGAPLFAAPDVLAEAGTTSPGAYQEVLKTEDAERWTEELERLTEDETKYKM